MTSRDDLGMTDMSVPQDDGLDDMNTPAVTDMDVMRDGVDDMDDSYVIRGRFESATPVRECGEVVSWNAPDGLLLRPQFDLCGDDMAALAQTIVSNLDAADAKGAKAMLVIGQGGGVPASWTSECESFDMDSGTFSSTICLPWDESYQQKVRSAFTDHIGPAVKGHPALKGVYFTISTMTNGSELHFRVPKGEFPYPGDEAFQGAYFDMMDIHQEAFDVPIVFEAGHCIFDLPGALDEDVDCQTPIALYRHARQKYGVEKIGIALWNCAERFWVNAQAEGHGVRELLEEATRDGASIGCQTVGSFTNGACRFSNDEVADYGYRPSGPGQGDDCPESSSFDPEAACVDTMNWFTGRSRLNEGGVVIKGTWAENWSKDFAANGIYNTSTACKEAIDSLVIP